MSDEESGGGDLTCHWGTCSNAFESSKLLDQHVEVAHIKAKKAAGAGAGKGAEKGMMCEWAHCDCSEKIFRDSWNLVTHMRYKHTHYKPFPCVHAGCKKSFVQLHQMKKHSKTPHGAGGGGGGGGGAAAGGGGGGRGRKRVVLTESSDAEYEELVLVAAEAAKKQKGRPVPPRVVVSTEDQRADEELARTVASGRGRARTPQSAAEAEAAGALAAVEMEVATERPLTPLDHDRSSMVMSPTSLLLSNTNWQAGSGRTTLWSPTPGSFVTDGHGGTPLPALDELHSSTPTTPVRHFATASSFVPSGAFVPIGSSDPPTTQGEPSFPPPSHVTPSRPIPSPLPVNPMFK